MYDNSQFSTPVFQAMAPEMERKIYILTLYLQPTKYTPIQKNVTISDPKSPYIFNVSDKHCLPNAFQVFVKNSHFVGIRFCGEFEH